MRVATGCDILRLKTFLESDAGVLEKLFTPAELSRNHPPETLAGFFAAKEAVVKALDLPHGSWHDVEIHKEPSGKPFAKMTADGIVSGDISISHDGDYAMATAVFLLES